MKEEEEAVLGLWTSTTPAGIGRNAWAVLTNGSMSIYISLKQRHGVEFVPRIENTERATSSKEDPGPSTLGIKERIQWSLGHGRNR